MPSPTVASLAAWHEDRSLPERLHRGEAHALETLVDHYGGWIYRVAVRVLGDPRGAEEVTRDVLQTAVRKIHTFKSEAALSIWLHRVAATKACERARGRDGRVDVSLNAVRPVLDEQGHHAEPVVDWSRELEDPAVAAQTRQALEQAISELPQDDRVVLVLGDVEGMTNEEVARVLGLTVAAVKARLHRARLFVRKGIGHDLEAARRGRQ